MPSIAALALFLTLGSIPADQGVSKPAPDCCADKKTDSADAELAWTDLTGRELRLEHYRGRFLVLNFWATWCLPCREEMPALVEIQNRYGMYGVQVVGASTDPVEERAAVVELAREYELNFPVLLGANTAQMKSLGLGEAIPATVILDPDGKIAERFSGIFELRELEKVLDRLLGQDEPVRTAALEHDHEHDDGHDQNHGTTGASLVPS